MDAQQLRTAFTSFFEDRGHKPVASASLIPHDPTVLFTIAGMVPFKPYFLGESVPPHSRMTSVQKCFRNVDIDIVGTTERHCTFFEMLGNFSFGDYFKTEAIPFAWELITEVLGIDGDRLWATVHFSDDDAEEIWADSIGVPRDRIQRMGEDNFWKMGPTGPCGPCSELYYDRGPEFGAEGGPANGGEERYVEIWNLVFMQSNRLEDGTLVDLPRRNIDTGAGLERILPVVQGVRSLFETDLFVPVIDEAAKLTKTRYGVDPSIDVSLKILADHARSMAMVIADGVLPSNEGRGYVLRRVIRRAVRRAHQLGLADPFCAALVTSVSDVLGVAYPALVYDLDLIQSVVDREEGSFRRTLESGSSILFSELEGSTKKISGEVAFRLHDTHGFPIELTVEMAAESGAEVDLAGFEEEMRQQRERARAALRERRSIGVGEEQFREVLDSSGATKFTGYEHYEEPARVVAVFPVAGSEAVDILLDRTPFYAESGGQVGDVGSIVTETGKATVTDTQQVLPGLIAHRAEITGEIFANQDALAVIEAQRRERIRRNHTGTHLLHAALREVLGDHVRQQSSWVGPDRLRFDFSHSGPLDSRELSDVVGLVQGDVLSDAPVSVVEAPKSEAEAMGALAFFGDKYGEIVRVVRAGSRSTEFCGGTHVDSLGMIGPIAVISEASIGSGKRRIEATTGFGTMERYSDIQKQLEDAAVLLSVEPTGVVGALERLLERQRQNEKQLAQLKAGSLEAEASNIASAAQGIVVARRDDLPGDALRDLAQLVHKKSEQPVVLAGAVESGKVAVAVATKGDPNAGTLVKELAAIVGGGGGGSPQLGVAGGRDVGAIDALLSEANRRLAGE